MLLTREISPETEVRRVRPLVNIWENDQAIFLEAEMPGLEKDQIDVELKEDELTIFGRRKEQELGKDYEALFIERPALEYRRSFVLGNEVARDKVKAEYVNGILKLTLSKHEAAQPKKISIQ